MAVSRCNQQLIPDNSQAFLGGPSHIGCFDPEKLETILKKLLQDDYERYYQTARQNIISSYIRPTSGKGDDPSSTKGDDT